MNIEFNSSQTSEDIKPMSPALQEVTGMGFNYSEEEFTNLAASEGSSMAMSEDAVLRDLQNLARGEGNVPQTIDRIRRTLDRESMDASPKKQIFMEAAQDLANRNGYKVEILKQE